MSGFIAKHGLWTEEQTARATEILEQIRKDGIQRVRIGWGDQHGIVRGKVLTVDEFARACVDGKDFQLVTAIFDPTNHPIVPPFSDSNDLGIDEMIGLPDGILVPDPSTFRVLPYVEATASILSDAYFVDGNPCPVSTRQVLRSQLDKLRSKGHDMIVGLECEFTIFKLDDPMLSPADSGYPPAPPKVSMISHGYQYLTESRGDEIDEILTALHSNLEALGLPVATLEDEWGPGQIEITFAPMQGMEAADSVLVFRTAVKQICRRLGYHASFMAKPPIPNIFPSGWHLHQSLVSTSDGSPSFVADEGSSNPMSNVGMAYLGGLLEHAPATSLFTTPTVNGYKRHAPDSFAPLRVNWGIENRGVMLRVLGGPGDKNTHLENRIGEPCSNPYLFMASQLIAGQDGMANNTHPGEPVRAAYSSERPLLPGNLQDAIAAFRSSDLMKSELGSVFHNYFSMLKQHELNRFWAEVTDWESREYFAMY